MRQEGDGELRGERNMPAPSSSLGAARDLRRKAESGPKHPVALPGMSDARRVNAERSDYGIGASFRGNISSRIAKW